MTSSADLPAAADTLSRAADAIRAATTEHDPAPWQPLAAVLDDAALTALGNHRYVMVDVGTLAVAARLLLGEEDGEPTTVTVEAGGRLVDVPRLPLADGRREEETGD